MRNFLCASALALAAAFSPEALNAQDNSTVTPTPSWVANAEQQGMIAAWPAERQTIYRAWDPAWQEYFWSLTPSQQTGWWALTDEQRAQVLAMTPPQRAQAWTSIEAQLAGQPPRATPATPAQPNAGMGEPATPATPATPSPRAGGMKGMGGGMGAMEGHMGSGQMGRAAVPPPPASAMNKTYPVCTKMLQDNCRNRGGK